ncbi:MAG: ATP-binding sensor histidine kinase [Nostoc sp.]|uniref:trifunctional serine/threonine-protein kinase/ATP-binding protein/sensor histidine kinase n=1 Tax=Nostoc sp. TaxID=1180 RepID=UPI002FF4CF6E
MVSTTVSIPGYKISEQLYNGSRTLVYRGYRDADSLLVVIKLLKNPYPTFSELLSFRNQYTIAKNLNSPLIIQTYSLQAYQNGYGLVMEDFGGISLKDYFTSDQTQYIASLQEFLEIAIALCNTLDVLYRERIIHKDIKPANILINPETKQVKLIDFSIASLLPRETQTLINPNVLEGTLAYISPEQTGRMNRGIDYRTDFYSLGVTFYELLTGELPFQSNDPMELVHCHIAKLPPLLGNREEIPQVICDIVMKLMAKNAESRYQSALGLKFDLENCLSQLQLSGKIESFEIASRDVCDRFIIPEKLYGRETEVENLLQAFERVSLGATEMMLVAGFSGIGKTAVVNEVHKPIVRQRGYFIKGKYDQFQRNIPFSGFVQAFRDLMGQLLSESDSQVNLWKTKILEAVGDNGQVLIDVIPELEQIIDPQPPATELSGSAGQNRFNLLMQKFIKVFTSLEHPLVIFLDDLQWADSASLKLLQLLIEETGYLLILGAYRDNEVSPVHPFVLTVDDMIKTGAVVNTITLRPLSVGDMNQLVADTLNCKLSLAQPLTELVHQKTKGNPFFGTQFLKVLHDDHLISFAFPQSSSVGVQGGWQCDLTQVKALAITDDVVEFMALQLQKLPVETQDILKLAACIGAQFDLQTLAIISKKSLEEAAADLWKALQEGLIIPNTEVYKFFSQSDSVSVSDPTANPTYHFLHDRAQQAAYSLIYDDQRNNLHLAIGRLLLSNTMFADRDENIFAIANHFNQGIMLIIDPREGEKIAHLNLKAGKKANAATAYSDAVTYLRAAQRLLADNAWQSQYQLALEIANQLALATCLSGDFQKMEEIISLVIANARSLHDQVTVYETRLQALVIQNHALEAVQTSLIFVEKFGIKFPKNPQNPQILLSLFETKLVLFGKSIQSLENLPAMQDIDKIAIIKILSKMLSSCYIASPNLLPILVFRMVKMFAQHGNSSLSAFIYIWYGLIMCGVVQDIDTGYEFGALALKIVDKFDAKEVRAKVLFGVYNFVSNWKIHIKDTITPLLQSYQIGLETGDIEYGSWAVLTHCMNAYFVGNQLSEVEQNFQIYSEAIAKLNQDAAFLYMQIFQQTVQNLLGESANAAQLAGKLYCLAEMEEKQQEDANKTGLLFAYTNQGILDYLFDQIPQAAIAIQKGREVWAAGTAMYIQGLFCFYESLIYLAAISQDKLLPSKKRWHQIKKNQKQMQKWASHAPMNFQHKWDLVVAEQQRVLDNKLQAITYYDRAISGAKVNGYVNEEALANELAAKFYLEWGKEKIAAGYMQEAYYCYANWGAKAKVADLEQRYSQLLAPILQQTCSPFCTYETISALGNFTSISCSSSNISLALDLAAILKASQTLSGEIELEKLLSVLLHIVIENAGADKCVFMLAESGNLLIKALAQLSQNGVQKQAAKIDFYPMLLNPQSVEDSPDVPVSLIHTVKRTLQPAVIVDATLHPQLINDSYIHRHQPKSILCSPILHASKLIAVLYLENNLVTGAFTSDRVELLNLLCAQAAISLENAQLYAQEQEKSQDLEQALTDLQNAQLQMVQSEKMSALGNLVAGVAHEMNNPLGFISASLEQAKPTFGDIIEHLKLYQENFPNKSEEIKGHESKIDLEYSLEDLPKMIDSMSMACDRLKNISTSLRTFSRSDKNYKVPFNIHEGIDSTILILKHRLKANEQHPTIEVVTNYGDLPQIQCFPGQLNQVFMNLLANAIDALEESNTERSFVEIKANPNCITITTSVENNLVKITIADNGKGMSESVKEKIFDHLFTTKAVGKGTGLGLAIARQIVEETHGGKLIFNSILGEGTEFIIEISV